MSKSIQSLVDDFAKHVQAQRAALKRGDVAAGNRHADKCFAAWDTLRNKYGNAGRDGLVALFQHPDTEVKLMAATFLLRHKTGAATRILEEAAAGGDYAARLTLDHWRDGTWRLDPSPEPNTGGCSMSKPIPQLVDDFAKHVLAQREAMDQGDVAVGNRHAVRYGDAWDSLVDEHGDTGRDGLAALLRHPSIHVRVMAAAHLLRHKTDEATRVLQEAKTAGHFGAEQALERWREGTWNLDPAPPPKPEE